jgi:RNA polymerase sigma factor (sigma-70 family)
VDADRVRYEWRRILKQLTRPEESDAVLLRRFVEQQDAEAFAELVHRYDGLVWSQCRHLLGRDADADDAFQATFLVLIRSAKKIRSTGHLGPWLHGVAYRVCLNARRASAKRARREQKAALPEVDRPVSDTAWDETLAAVHAEVNRLPETLRVPFVLCCLQGKDTSAAAAELGLKLGTFSARLSRAKKAVLDALAKRGCASVGAVAAMAGVTLSAPPALANRVVALMNSQGTISAEMVALTQGVAQMGVSRFRLTAAAMVVAASLVAGSFGFWSANAQGPGAGASGPPEGAAGGPGGPYPGGPGAPSIGMPGGGPPSKVAANLFEYKVLELRGRADTAEKELNRFGDEGWDLVSVTAHASAGGVDIKTAYLKRHKRAAPGGNPTMPGLPNRGSGLPGFPPGGAGLPPFGLGPPGAGGGGTPPAGGGPAGIAPAKKPNLVRSTATIEAVSKSWITSEQGAQYAIDENTRYYKKVAADRATDAKFSDLKPGAEIEIHMNKETKAAAYIVIQ